jgi:hypothetical protein
VAIFYFLFLLFFVVVEFELRAYTLNHFTSPFFVLGFFENILPGLASNLDPPDLCLLISWDYRCEPLAPSQLELLTEHLLWLPE